MKKIVYLIFAACLILSLAACTQNTPAPTLSSTLSAEAESQTQAVPTLPSSTEATISESPSAVYEAPMAAISLPILTESHTDAQGKEIAYYHHQDVSIVLPDADVAQAITLDLLNRIDRKSSTAKSIFAAATSDYSGQTDWYPYSFTVTYQPMRLDENILSLFGYEASFDGSPRSSHNAVAVTYDLTTAEALSLRTIFHEESFADAVCSLLLDALAPRAGELFADYESIVRAIFSTNVPIDNWYFSDEGLCFFFSPYEIAPYTAGTIVGEIPYEKLSGLLKDAYFPSEQLSYSGALLVTPLDENTIPENLTQFAEITLDSGSEKLLITCDGSISNIKLHCASGSFDSSTEEYTVMALAGMGPTDAILLQLDAELINDRLTVSFESYGTRQTLRLTKSNEDKWVFTK